MRYAYRAAYAQYYARYFANLLVLSTPGACIARWMAVPFQEFRLIYPPHPAVTWRPEDIRSLSGYVAQYKYDDWRTLIYFLPNGEIEFFGRNKQKLPRYRPPESMLNALQSLKLERGHYHVLDGGLLHYKTQRVKDTLIIWDILVHSSSYLLGTNYQERYELLKALSGDPKDWISLPLEKGEGSVPIALKIAKNLWLAPIFETGFRELFERGSKLPEIEGLVLKNPKAPLERAFRKEENARWMVRARKPRIDYRF